MGSYTRDQPQAEKDALHEGDAVTRSTPRARKKRSNVRFNREIIVYRTRIDLSV